MINIEMSIENALIEASRLKAGCIVIGREDGITGKWRASCVDHSRANFPLVAPPEHYDTIEEACFELCVEIRKRLQWPVLSFNYPNM